ncbi:MAG: hypothetical protein M1820_004062 [Bogoriella megaspora]|nr:MAG: hypothetical protein M1820_004062 [Bogoriella megaspora]
MLRLQYLLPFIAALGSALPQSQSCATTTVEVIIPTTTYTFSSTDVVTTTATTPDDLGTFTEYTTISDTTTISTLTTTATLCQSTVDTLTQPETTTVYTTAGSNAAPSKRGGLFARQDSACTVTSTFTTTYGATYTNVPAGKTSTFTQYSEFTEHWVTKTSSGAHAYAVATASTTVTSSVCGATTVAANTTTATTTQDARCAPTAQVSQVYGFGLNYLEEVPSVGGAVFVTTAKDAGSCCQLCAEANECASSAWDIRTNQCRLQFEVDRNSGQGVCGQVGVTGVSEAGPNHPMAPGTGWYLAAVCGQVNGHSGKPDDGS